MQSTFDLKSWLFHNTSISVRNTNLSVRNTNLSVHNTNLSVRVLQMRISLVTFHNFELFLLFITVNEVSTLNDSPFVKWQLV